LLLLGTPARARCVWRFSFISFMNLMRACCRCSRGSRRSKWEEWSRSLEWMAVSADWRDVVSRESSSLPGFVVTEELVERWDRGGWGEARGDEEEGGGGAAGGG
jgi:hypothetical protein